MKSRRLLILDDDALSAAVLADAFRARGWEATAFGSAGELLGAINERRPDALLIDFVLPSTDGAALCAAVRLAPGPRVPIVLYSGSDVPPELAARAGADGLYGKPLPIDEIHRRLSGLLAAAEAESPARVGPAVRLPAGEVVGPDAQGVAATEEGALAPGWLPPLLLRLHDRQFTGVLEVAAPDWRCKVFFNRAAPASARSSDRETELGNVLGELGLVSRERLEACATEARRRGRQLGEELVSAALIDRPAAERALREQLLRRLERAALHTEGQYTLSPAEPLGLAGYEVPSAVAYWRCGGQLELEVDDDDRQRFVRPAVPPWAWTLLDPAGLHGSARRAIVTGARLAACLAAGGSVAARMVAVLRRFGSLSLVDEAPPVWPGAHAADTEATESRVAAQARRLAEADHYTVLGLAPDASDFEVSAAYLTAVSAAHPDTLPPEVSAATRERARRLFAAVVEAGRILGDPERRAIYDAELNRRERRGLHAPRGADNADVLAERGREAFARGDYVTAAGLLRGALRLEGQNADVLAMLGLARHRACDGDPDAGLRELRQALDIDPDAEYARYWLAQLHLERGEPDVARKLLRQALSTNQEFELARDALRSLEP